MPLSEFLRMARGRLESSQQKTDASSRSEDDLAELVWENGQVVTQGQSSRKATASRFGKFGVESIMNDMAPEVPDDEMVPWLSYPIDGQDYVTELLPEISGMSARSSLLSGVSDIANRDNGAQGRDVVSGSLSMKVERQNVRPNVLNFSHFSRAANLVKANADGNSASGSSGVGRMEIREKGVISPVKSTPDRFNSTPKDIEVDGSSAGLPKVNSREAVVVNTPKGATPPERMENLCIESSIKNDNLTKGVPDGEKIVEPMVASSSVGSGNSADRVSCEQTHNSKRKFHDIDESDYRNDDVDTESADAKKPTHVRGSKRGRAAEVHNLSERRRRDRINEKMRALQELIPNCNKADKASMLDEAIEYLKTLQLQVQIMSIGAGLCMPPVMYPTGMQHIHPAHVPPFPPMGVGMGAGMGFGMGMMDMNGVSSGYPMYPVPTMHVPHFRPPVSGIPNFQRVPGPPVYGQGLQNSVPRQPFVPLTRAPPVTSAMGMNALRNGSSSEVACTSSVCNAEASISMNDKSNQATTKALTQSASGQDNKHATHTIGPAAVTNMATTIDISRQSGKRDESALVPNVPATGGDNSGLA